MEAEVLDGLARVEESLAGTADPDDELLTEASRHLIAAGGTRFGAMRVLLAAQSGDPRDPRVIEAAVAIELTHLATLFHDDVMDEALVRRGHPSVTSRWTNSVAILTGDFLFAQASQILAGVGPEAVKIQAQPFTRLVTGQMAETVGPRPGQDPLDFYMHVITEKTGSLIATSGRFGALFSGAPAEVADRIAAACEQIGVAWQLSDDVIDIASDSSQSGKTPGTHLRHGVRTLRLADGGAPRHVRAPRRVAGPRGRAGPPVHRPPGRGARHEQERPVRALRLGNRTSAGDGGRGGPGLRHRSGPAGPGRSGGPAPADGGLRGVLRAPGAPHVPRRLFHGQRGPGAGHPPGPGQGPGRRVPGPVRRPDPRLRRHRPGQERAGGGRGPGPAGLRAERHHAGRRHELRHARRPRRARPRPADRAPAARV